jgi:hypothetical protein
VGCRNDDRSSTKARVLGSGVSRVSKGDDGMFYRKERKGRKGFQVGGLQVAWSLAGGYWTRMDAEYAERKNIKRAVCVPFQVL